MSNFVFVLDTHKRPLDPIHPGTARHLLNTGKAAVFRKYPFTIILKVACPDAPVQDLELKIDPGSKVTGSAIKQGNKVIFGAELQHRGQQIKDALLSRRQLRRGRRNRKTRYRQARFLNRTRPDGWLAPSLQRFERNGTARHDGNGRTNQIQPHSIRTAQSTLVRCGVCGQG
jgi:RRXRR protein